MAVSALLSLGARAMAANYAALSVTGNNISNANTPGYSVQTAKLETAFSQQTGSGYFGKGVNVTTVTRAHSDFLTRESAATASVAAGDAARQAHLQQLEGTFKTGEDGIGSAAQVMFNSFVDVASKPQDSAARQVALAQVGEVASRFRAADDQLSSMQQGVTAELKASIGTVNTLTAQIASLNGRIAGTQGTGQPPNSLLDERDSAIADLSKLVSVSTVPSSDGSVAIFIGGGQRLVLGAQSTPLSAVPDPYDSTKVQLGISDGGVLRAFPDGYVSGGTIAGLTQFQNHDLVDARNVLGQMASAISGAMNKQQSLGLDLGTPPGSGAPLLAVGAPAVLPSTNNAKVGGVPVASSVVGGVRVSSVSIATTDASQLRASNYELYAAPGGPAGTYQLTRLSDNTVTTVSDGDVVDGFKISVASPLPATGDRFLLEPVGNAIGTMARVMDDPKGIAAASPVVGTIGVANAGSATIASVTASSTALNPNLKATVTFTNANGGFSYSLVDTTGTLPTTTGTGTWMAGQPISLNGWAMTLNGVPTTGDTLTVTKTTFPAGDNGNANALMGLRDQGMLGRIPDGMGGLTKGDTVTDAYSSALADVGVRVQRATIMADQSASLAADAKTAEVSKSGVNLDEEAARLIQFQQSYQAAAKMLQVAQTMFDTILQVASH